jgi:FixJ family two-component response regulator
VTGFADISEPEAIQKGAAGRIEKPINREKMLRLIQHVSAENSLPLGKIS